MYENARFLFVALLYISFGCLFALAFLNLFTWGGYLEYLLAAAIAVGVALIGTIITSV